MHSCTCQPDTESLFTPVVLAGHQKTIASCFCEANVQDVQAVAWHDLRVDLRDVKRFKTISKQSLSEFKVQFAMLNQSEGNESFLSSDRRITS